MSCCGPDSQLCRCRSLSIQLESLLCDHLLAQFVLSYRTIPQLVLMQRGKSAFYCKLATDSGEIQSLVTLRTRFSRLQVNVVAHTAGVTLVRPPANAFCRVLQIYPHASSKPDSGQIRSRVMLRTRLCTCKCRSMPVQPESFMCHHLRVRILSRITDPSLNKLQYKL